MVTLSDTQTYTIGRTPLDEGAARHRNPYLTAHYTRNTQTTCTRRDSNPLSQQANDRRPTP